MEEKYKMSEEKDKIEQFIDFTADKNGRCNNNIIAGQNGTYEWNTANGYRWRFLCTNRTCVLTEINDKKIRIPNYWKEENKKEDKTDLNPFEFYVGHKDIYLENFYPQVIYPNVLRGNDMGRMIAFIANQCNLNVNVHWDVSDLTPVYRALYGLDSYYYNSIGMQNKKTVEYSLTTRPLIKGLQELMMDKKNKGFVDIMIKNIKWCAGQDQTSNKEKENKISVKQCNIFPSELFETAMGRVFGIDVTGEDENVEIQLNKDVVNEKYEEYKNNLKNTQEKNVEMVYTNNDEDRHKFMLKVLTNPNTFFFGEGG
jgi:hypothetical protein